MKKRLKSYVEKVYYDKSSSIYELSIRDPLQVKNDGKVVKFRFYDEELDYGNMCYLNKVNVSSWYYLGKRLSLEEIKNLPRNLFINTLIVDMENSNCKYACKTRVGAFVMMEEDAVTFEEYTGIKEENMFLIYQPMFHKLKKFVGKNVKCSMWYYGDLCKINDVVEEIDDFFNIKIGDIVIPFIGFCCAISSITSLDGEVLYFNPNVENYNCVTNEEILDARRISFGEKFVEEEIKLIRDLKERYQKEILKTKDQLIEEGFAFINPELKSDWVLFVENNIENERSIRIVEAVIFMMCMFNAGVSFLESEKKLEEKEHFSHYAFSYVANTLFYFSKVGEEYRSYWNKKVNEEKNIALILMKNR